MLWREVRDGIEGAPAAIHETVEWPASLTGLGSQGSHAVGVQFGVFFPVDLDRDIGVIENVGDLFVFEAFVGHDMAPVTGGIADGNEERPVQLV